MKRQTKAKGPRVWFIPSWNGDVRLVPSEDGKTTILTVEKPTPAELMSLGAVSVKLVEEKWLAQALTPDDLGAGEGAAYREAPLPITIGAPIEKVGPIFVAALKPGPAVITAIKLQGGRVEVVEHSEPGKATEEKLTSLAKKPSEAAATVKRPTPSCPDCYVGNVNTPATQVLLSFLTEEQHKTWSRERYIVVRGGLTRHRYIIAHRESEIAARNGRIAFDADDLETLHFHDQSVPPEEEVLAALLILQFREPWLRNEATCFYGMRFRRVFKNPFGDIQDGVLDANLTRAVGQLAMAVVG